MLLTKRTKAENEVQSYTECDPVTYLIMKFFWENSQWPLPSFKKINGNQIYEDYIKAERNWKINLT